MTAAARVLIVDDRDIVRETLRDILDDFDCDFTEADKGERAIEILRSQKFDVLFLDLRLPDIPGMEVLRELRRSPIIQGKVIILTGQPDPATRVEAEDMGAVRYLTKPLEWVGVREAFTAAIVDSELPFRPPQPESKAGTKTPLSSKRRKRTKAVLRLDTDRRPHLLVVDDDHSWLDTLEQELGGNFDLTLTTSAKEACRLIRKEIFDLVVLDKWLQGEIAGLDVLSRMRRARPDLRALVLTGYSDFKSANESGRRGAVEYVSKGQLATLSDRISRILSQELRHKRVFLSYDRIDKVRVASLFYRLIGRGYLPWMDVMSIVSGMNWASQIQKSVEQSDYFVCCWSSRTRYENKPLKRELEQALERQQGLPRDSVFFIPARLEDAEIPENLRRFQYVDLFRRGGFENLLQALSPPEEAAR